MYPGGVGTEHQWRSPQSIAALTVGLGLILLGMVGHLLIPEGGTIIAGFALTPAINLTNVVVGLFGIIAGIVASQRLALWFTRGIGLVCLVIGFVAAMGLFDERFAIGRLGIALYLVIGVLLIALGMIDFRTVMTRSS